MQQVRATGHIIQPMIGVRPMTLCIDETGDVKKGSATDYAAKQYIGNEGQTANGIVSVNVSGVKAAWLYLNYFSFIVVTKEGLFAIARD